MNSFLFIIPATPKRLLSEHRHILQKMCLNNLLLQNYSNWKALWIDVDEPPLTDSKIFHLKYSGKKEEKLQKTSNFILNNKLKFDYIIRLDDDDLFNPNLLHKIRNKDFDIYTDFYQYFWSPDICKITRKLCYWFPNTCIHKRESAFTKWGYFATGGPFEKIRETPFLIENDHTDFHKFYRNKKIFFSNENSPVYIRTITQSSVSSDKVILLSEYLNGFGVWQNNFLIDFTNTFSNLEGKQILKQSLSQKLIHLKNDFLARLNYKKIVL